MVSAALSVLPAVSAFAMDHAGIPLETILPICSLIAMGTSSVPYVYNQQFPPLKTLCTSALNGANAAALVAGIVNATQHISETLNPYAVAAIGGTVTGAVFGCTQKYILSDENNAHDIPFAAVEPAWRRNLYQSMLGTVTGAASLTAEFEIVLGTMAVVNHFLKSKLSINYVADTVFCALPIGVTTSAVGGAALGAVAATIPHIIEGVKIGQERQLQERNANVALMLLTAHTLGKDLGALNGLPDAAILNIASFIGNTEKQLLVNCNEVERNIRDIGFVDLEAGNAPSSRVNEETKKTLSSGTFHS